MISATIPAKICRGSAASANWNTCRHCQTNLTGPAKGADLKRSGCKLTPFRERGNAVLFEDVARVEVTVEVEVVVD